MPEINLRGIPVDFPHEPYQVQKDFMEKVIQGLQTRQNCLLESPTGTGKTLSLLCAVLAWRDAFIVRQQQNQLGPVTGYALETMKRLNAAISTNPDAEDFSAVPQIFFASRTHTQLSNAVKELKRTKFRPSTSIMASRDQLCVDSQVLKASSNAAKNRMCRAKVTKGACSYYTNVNNAKSAATLPPIPDLEDIMLFARQHSACPYYLSRTETADVTFLPYNYLIDENMRKAQKLVLKNSIIIFDEAHNLETSCNESTSFSITDAEWGSAIAEAKLCFEKASRLGYTGAVSASDITVVIEILTRCQETINSVNLTNRNLSKPGEYVFEIFSKAGITFTNYAVLFTTMESIITEHMELASTTRSKNPKSSLSNILTAFKTCYRPELEGINPNMLKNRMAPFKVYIKEEFIKPYGQERSVLSREFSLWCFSSGVAMKNLMDQGVRCCILASGTLAPLDSFAGEMGIPFPIRLENPHVIDPKQAFVSVVTRGPGRIQLNSNYENRSNEQYIVDLGELILATSKNIPDGLLVFFPSYPVMDLCINQWKAAKYGGRSLWDRLKAFKEPLVEPKNKTDFANAIQAFYHKIDDPSNIGAIFFAVCRGKVSEGVDFADAKGRAVIVTGLPYPAAKDPKVMLKKQYLTFASSRDKTVQNGDTWYKQQAARAVNQALGRVIRHIKDFGAIILADERFATPVQKNQLPVWVRSFVKSYEKFDQMNDELGQFFKLMKETMPAPVKKALPPPPPVNQGLIFKGQLSRPVQQEQPLYLANTSQKVKSSAMNPMNQKGDMDKIRESHLKLSMSMVKADPMDENKPTKRPADDKLEGEKDAKRSPPASWLQNCRTVLTHSEFIMLKERLQEYKKKEIPLTKMVDFLVTILVEGHKAIQLCRDFANFLTARATMEFDQELEKRGIALPEAK